MAVFRSIPLLYLLLVLVFALYVACQYSFSPLVGIPGPLGASFSPMWMVKHAWQGDMRRQMINPHSKYGKLVRTGPNEISMSDVEAIKIYVVPLQPIVHPLRHKAEPVLNSVQDLVQSFGRVIGTVSSKATANSICSQSKMKGSMPLGQGSQ